MGNDRDEGIERKRDREIERERGEGERGEEGGRGIERRKR